MKKRHLILLSIATATLLSGCANGYKQFYTAAPNANSEVIAKNRAAPPLVEPVVERPAPPVDIDSYRRRGYELLGVSEFSSGSNHKDEQAIQQAKDVGADLVVIIPPQYQGSTTQSMPLTLPKTTTSYSSGTATAYGQGGSVTAYGTGTTTTYGTSTTYIPVTTHRNHYGAAFFAKMKTNIGLNFRPLNGDERQDLQTNQGVVVAVVVEDSRAFHADFLEGDVVVAVDDVKVTGLSGFRSLMESKRGTEVTFNILRKGKAINKVLNLGQ